MKKIAVVLLCFCLLPFSFLIAYAENLNENTTASGAVITVTVPNTHTLAVKINTKNSAYVYINDEKGDTFEIDRLSEPTFEIRTEKGYDISKVVLNGENITDKLVNGKYHLPSVYEDLVLEVETKENPQSDVSSITSSNVSSNTSKAASSTVSRTAAAVSRGGTTNANTTAVATNTNSSSTKTGDSRHLEIYFILFAVSMIGFFAAVKCKRENME